MDISANAIVQSLTTRVVLFLLEASNFPVVSFKFVLDAIKLKKSNFKKEIVNFVIIDEAKVL